VALSCKFSSFMFLGLVHPGVPRAWGPASLLEPVRGPLVSTLRKWPRTHLLPLHSPTCPFVQPTLTEHPAHTRHRGDVGITWDQNGFVPASWRLTCY
jgi:hypothetical protein